VLYSGGFFENAGCAFARNIAKWNGSSWAPVGNGITEQVYTLAVYNNELYAGGAFCIFNGNAGDYIMSWDGTQWKAAGFGTDGPVIALYPDISGLIVGGSFSTAGGDSADNIAKYFTATGIDEKNSNPYEFSLSQNYPNPFNPETKIKYTVPSTLEVSLKVYNVLGKEVATLLNEVKQPGNYEARFSVDKNNGIKLSSGIYLYKLTAGSFIQIRKMIFLK